MSAMAIRTRSAQSRSSGGTGAKVVSQAIMITPSDEGWRWELIDAEGDTTASGLCEQQIAAMDLAWRAARSATEFAGQDSPEIFIRHLRAQSA